MPSFNDFNLQSATHAVLANMEITEPTPIQAEAIPALLAGSDLVGQSTTGSGKTLAYGIPLVERLARDKRVVQALVLVPTRELAVQVNAVLSTLATSRRLSTALLVGGRPYGNQLSALRYGSQIVVGTPGRVKDHLDRGSLVLSQLRICVLDEADQMLDSGFAPVIEEILGTTPDTRQTALFSATIPDWIAKLEKKFLKNPVKVDLTPASDAQSSIEQIAYQVPQDQKMAALCTLLRSTEGESSLIFGKTKYGVEKLGKQLSKLGFTVGTLHGNKSQRAREEVLTAFRRGHVQTLLATNVAARGLDIIGIYQVINYELPESSDLFTHRIGRTGRMGRQGKAITLLVPSDMPKWRIMARSLGQAVALQRLVIDEEAISTMPTARSEAPVTRELEQNGEQQSKRDRKNTTSNQERSGQARPKQDSQMASGVKKRQKDSVTSGATARTPISQPERSFSSKERYGRRGAGRHSSFGRTTGKHKAHAFAAVEPQYRTARRKPRATSTGQSRREGASKRSASR
jgi:ATP-dependent RNA helicase DeaD